MFITPTLTNFKMSLGFKGIQFAKFTTHNL